MNIEFVTKDDLNSFREQLIKEISTLFFSTQQPKIPEWLRGYEVKKLLKISTGTLQNLRIKRQLNPSKIGGILLYRMTEIESLLAANHV